MRTAILLASIILCAATITAQRNQYGKPEDLKGLTKVFVDTGGDIKNRERIQKEIESAKLGVTLLDSEDDAEIIINFGADKTARVEGGTTNGTGHIRTDTFNTGKGGVYVMKNGQAVIVISYEGEETHLWEKKPATSFGKAFVKAYKKANGLK